MTLQCRGGSRRSSPLRRSAAPALVLLGGLSAALASDGDLQRVLLDHGCVRPRIETVLKRDSFVVYRANCLGTSHKVLDVACAGSHCTVSGRSAEPEEQYPPDAR